MALLLATIAGFGGIIGIFVRFIRGYNRISPYIAFFALLAVGLALEKQLTRRTGRSRKALAAVAILLLGYGYWEQQGFFRPEYEEIQDKWYQDEAFMNEVEAAAGDGAMLFTLPYMKNFENGSLNNMWDYTLLRGPLHSKTLKFTYGAGYGTKNDLWYRETSELEPDAIYHKSEYRERRNHYAVFWANRPYDGFDTARDAFIGLYGAPSLPEAVQNGRCTNSVAHGWAPVGAMQFHMALRPGESRELFFGLGYVENPEDEKFSAPGVINKTRAHAMIGKYRTPAQFDAAMDALHGHWDTLLSNYHAETGDEKVDRMVNIWNQYQCMVTFNMSRSASYFESGMGRGMGFRDSCQDLLGFVHIIPERARERILDIAATQFADGSAYHQYQPLTKKGNLAVGSGFNDDPLWLIAGVDAYLRETGDWSILDEVVTFDCDPDNAAPLMEHLRRSFRFTCTHLGPHKLPLIGRADWNDCLNLNCFSAHPGESFQITGPSEGPVAESVFIAGMFVKYGRAYADILRHLALTAEAAAADAAVAEMQTAVLDAGWDGAWFRRAYDAFGAPVGSKDCAEGQIFIEPQGMCVMAGIGKETGEAAQALKSVEDRLDSRFGIVLLQPAYTKYYLNLGEISSYPPGYKENAGIFCHNNPWITCAEAVLGHGARAFETYRKICPAYLEAVSEVHRTEPYVYSQMVAGKDAPTFGEAKNSWLTGTAAWTFVSISQAILGVQPELDGLRIDPCVPPEWTHLTLTRRFRGAQYRITVENSDGAEHGVRELYVDGVRQDGNLIAPAAPGSVVSVRVVLGG